MSTAGKLPNRVEDDLRNRSGIYANALIWATVFAFPLIGIADYILLDDFANMGMSLRVGASILIFLFYQVGKKKDWHPNVSINIAFFFMQLVLGFEVYVAAQSMVMYFIFQVIALVIVYNAVALWSLKEALIQYLLAVIIIAGAYVLGKEYGIDQFLKSGGALLLLSSIIPLTLPTAKFSANRLTSRKTLQLQQTLNELKIKNQELQQTKEALKRIEKKDSNRIRVAIHDLNNRI